MGLLSNGNITLVDLTDTRSVTLYLTTSLSKTQIETGNGKFEPDYSIGDGQVITPSLYFGQDLYNKDFNVKYLINNSEIENSDTLYVENNILYIKENLNKSSFFITAIIEETIEDPATKTEYTNIQAQLELTRLYNAEENYLPLISYDRDTFTHDNSEGITLKAILYKGGSEFNGEISYKWSSSINENFSSGNQSVEILRDQIDNIATFTCIMKVDENSYSTSVTLRDWTDPLSSQIISNKGIYLQNIDDEIELTCKIFRKNTEVDANNYIWKYHNDDDKENSPITINGANGKTLSINFNNLPITGKTSILFECEAQVKKAGTTDQYESTAAQTTIAISPAYRVEITPRNILILCDKDGNIKSEEDNFVKDITFKLLDLDGNILARATGDGVGNISFFDNIITAEPKEENLWDYNIKLESSKDKILENNYLINIPYTYFGFQDSDEIYLIKNIQGETGADGTPGRGINQVIEWYYTNNSTNENDLPSKGESNGWSKSIESPSINKKYLWNYEEIIYSDEESETTTPAIVGNFSEDGAPGKGIKDIINYYLTSSETTGITLNSTGWSEEVKTPTASEKYLWNYEEIIYDTDTPETPDRHRTAPCIIGNFAEDGATGNGISDITNWYRKSPSNTDSEANENTTWSETIPTLDSQNKYLWNKEIIKYTDKDSNGDNITQETTPAVISTYVTDGRGISQIIEYYYATTTKEEVLPEKKGSDEGGKWEVSPPELSVINKYLWNYEKIIYTDEEYITTDPAIIGVFGEDGAGIDKQEIKYCLSTNGNTAPTEGWDDEIPDLSNIESQFLWTKTTTTYTDNRDPIVNYSVSYLSKDGINGQPIESIKEQYCLTKSDKEEDKPNLEADWQDQVPSDFIKDGETQTLWVRYEMIYKDGAVAYSDPKPAKNVQDLNLFVKDTETFLDNEGIKFVATESFYNEDYGFKSTIADIRAGVINFIIEEDGNSSKQAYLTFNTEGLTIGSTESDYYSQILNGTLDKNYLNAGFYIKYNNSQTEQEEDVAILNTLGLRVKNINLNLEDFNFEQDLTITRTLTGGIAIGY